MSGGSFNYAYRKVEEMAESLHDKQSRPDLKAFANHLDLVAKTMKAIEWWFSGDSNAEEAVKLMAQVIHPANPTIEAVKALKEAIDNIDSTSEALTRRVEMLTRTKFVLVPVDLPNDPGPAYEAGEYSRRNWEAAMRDLGVDPGNLVVGGNNETNPDQGS